MTSTPDSPNPVRITIVATVVLLALVAIVSGWWIYVGLAIMFGAPILYALIVLIVFGGGIVGAVLLDLWDWVRDEDEDPD